MARSPSGRQTVLPEYTDAFSFRFSSGFGKKTHYVHEDNIETGVSGKSYCGRFTVRTADVREPLPVLSGALNPCKMCLRRMSDEELDVLAAMASACSQHEITREDILETDQ